MADFFQNGLITTLHDFRATDTAYLEQVLADATRHFRLGLILPVTASDMRAAPFGQKRNLTYMTSSTVCQQQ